MISVCLILFLAVAALWFFINEYPTLFGIYVTAHALRRIYFKAIIICCMTAAAVLWATGSMNVFMPENRMSSVLDCQSVILITLSALITLLVLRLFSVTGSVAYALIGAFQAHVIISGGDVAYRMMLSFLAAPALAFILSAFIRYICKLTLDRCHIHLITLSHYLRYVVIAGIAVLAFAAGLNWGGFLFVSARLVSSSDLSLWLIVLLTALLPVFLSSFIRAESDKSAGRFSDFSIYSVIAVGFATTVTLMIFTFDSVVGQVGLMSAPLSAGSLVFASIAGAETVQRTSMIEKDEYAREGMALIVAPLGSMLLAYLILYISGHNEESLVSFTVMAAAMIVLASLFFAGYVRRQRIQKEAVERLVYSQQQQIYENSRALNDMELKVVLSENQALHNAVEMKRQEVMNVALSIVEQRAFLESLDELVKRLSKSTDDTQRSDLIDQISASIKQRLSYDRDVDSQYFYAQAESLHEDFSAKLAENFPALTQQERRLAVLLRLGFPSKYIATLMNITPKSVEISRYRLRQKLGLSKGDNLVNFIKSI